MKKIVNSKETQGKDGEFGFQQLNKSMLKVRSIKFWFQDELVKKYNINQKYYLELLKQINE